MDAPRIHTHTTPELFGGLVAHGSAMLGVQKLQVAHRHTRRVPSKHDSGAQPFCDGCALDAAADQELKNHGRVAVPDAVRVSKNRWLIRCQHGADVPTSAHRKGHHWWSAQLPRLVCTTRQIDGRAVVQPFHFALEFHNQMLPFVERRLQACCGRVPYVLWQWRLVNTVRGPA